MYVESGEGNGKVCICDDDDDDDTANEIRTIVHFISFFLSLFPLEYLTLHVLSVYVGRDSEIE